LIQAQRNFLPFPDLHRRSIVLCSDIILFYAKDKKDYRRRNLFQECLALGKRRYSVTIYCWQLSLRLPKTDFPERRIQDGMIGLVGGMQW
jgi:hypothetical protein